MKQIGIVGIGHLGELHLKQWIEIVGKDAIVCFDTDNTKKERVEEEYQCKWVDSFEELLNHADIVDVVTPTQYHFDYAKKSIEQGKHTFIEKPVCETLEQLNELIDLEKKHQVKVQVGYIERFNEAFTSIEERLNHPKFFEIHRLAPVNPRGTEVSVVMDLMIHDLDIVTHLVNSEVKEIKASGVSILNKTPDIANARVEFENGAVANLTASRISMKRMRKMRIFRDGMYASIDFLKKESEIFEIKSDLDNKEIDGVQFVNSDGENKKLIQIKNSSLNLNPLMEELKSFFESVNADVQVIVSLLQSKKSLQLALKIQNMINN